MFCSINWGTFPEWLAAIASLATAVVVICFAGLNRTYLKEAARQYQRENRKAGQYDADEVQKHFDRASRGVEEQIRILQENKGLFEAQQPRNRYTQEIFEACVTATRIVSIGTFAEKVFDQCLRVGNKATRIAAVAFEDRTDQQFKELHDASVAFNVAIEEFMKQFRKELGLE